MQGIVSFLALTFQFLAFASKVLASEPCAGYDCLQEYVLKEDGAYDWFDTFPPTSQQTLLPYPNIMTGTIKHPKRCSAIFHVRDLIFWLKAVNPYSIQPKLVMEA